ncbi:hypothetical protein BKA70DRAFT_1403991 [Coprinopsis sp. MPI-PUGE-AT-0042]|nr:hypothetical protein BKA70DRAFT_1403991 [Coprinopsis sp. MPI-PUGE-AT-0042]
MRENGYREVDGYVTVSARAKLRIAQSTRLMTGCVAVFPLGAYHALLEDSVIAVGMGGKRLKYNDLSMAIDFFHHAITKKTKNPENQATQQNETVASGSDAPPPYSVATQTGSNTIPTTPTAQQLYVPQHSEDSTLTPPPAHGSSRAPNPDPQRDMIVWELEQRVANLERELNDARNAQHIKSSESILEDQRHAERMALDIASRLRAVRANAGARTGRRGFLLTRK